MISNDTEPLLHQKPLLYQIRGHRVAPVTEEELEGIASVICKIFKINKRTRFNMDRFIEQLAEKNITVDVVSDTEWLYLTDAACIPGNLSIYFPEEKFKLACQGGKEEISLLFHELSHILLGHVKVLHDEKSSPPTREEDAEWQADTLADYILCIMGIEPITKQYNLAL